MQKSGGTAVKLGTVQVQPPHANLNANRNFYDVQHQMTSYLAEKADFMHFRIEI